MNSWLVGSIQCASSKSINTVDAAPALRSGRRAPPASSPSVSAARASAAGSAPSAATAALQTAGSLGDLFVASHQHRFHLVELLLGGVFAREVRGALELLDDGVERGVEVIGRALVAQSGVPLLAIRSRSTWVSRDLPMPGSPLTSTTCPSPSLACCQRRSSSATSSSRPTRGVSATSLRAASKRLSVARRTHHSEQVHRLGHTLERVRTQIGVVEQPTGEDVGFARSPPHCPAQPALAAARRCWASRLRRPWESTRLLCPVSPTTTRPV